MRKEGRNSNLVGKEGEKLERRAETVKTIRTNCCSRYQLLAPWRPRRWSFNVKRLTTKNSFIVLPAGRMSNLDALSWAELWLVRVRHPPLTSSWWRFAVLLTTVVLLCYLGNTVITLPAALGSFIRAASLIFYIFGGKSPAQHGESQPQVKDGSVVNHVTAAADQSSLKEPALTEDTSLFRWMYSENWLCDRASAGCCWAVCLIVLFSARDEIKHNLPKIRSNTIKPHFNPKSNLWEHYGERIESMCKEMGLELRLNLMWNAPVDITVTYSNVATHEAAGDLSNET